MNDTEINFLLHRFLTEDNFTACIAVANEKHFTWARNRILAFMARDHRVMSMNKSYDCTISSTTVKLIDKEKRNIIKVLIVSDHMPRGDRWDMAVVDEFIPPIDTQLIAAKSDEVYSFRI